MDFKCKLPKWEIHNSQGDLVAVHELLDKSVEMEDMADELLSTPHYVSGYMKVLSDKMLLVQFMKHMNSLAVSCIEKARQDVSWCSTYSTGIVFLLNNFIQRYAEVFEIRDIDLGYVGQESIKVLYGKAIVGAHVCVDGRELSQFEDIKNYQKDADIRANSAGFIALIVHYNEEQFLDVLKRYLDNCVGYGVPNNFWYIIIEVVRRIEGCEL